MKKLLFIILIITSIVSCAPKTAKIDFENHAVFACINNYDAKDVFVYYDTDKTITTSESTGVVQYAYIDVLGERRLLNEYEIDNFICVRVHSNAEVEYLLNP